MLSKKLRRRVTHGWAFREHPSAEQNAIITYLETGEVSEHFPYKHLHKAAEDGKLGK